MLNLKGKKVVVIGGSSGMGYATALLAATNGAQVIIGGRTASKLTDAAARIGHGVMSKVVDAGNEASVIQFFDECGPIDHLAIPGSSIKLGQFKQTSVQDIEYSITNKFLSQALCARYCQLNEGGSIVFFSGVLAQRPGNSGLLGAINAAVETLAKGLAVELAPIRVNVVSPGMTEATNAYAEMAEENREAMFEMFREKLPTGSVGTPEDMAEAAVFLMRSPFVTGHVLCVDGGGLCV